MSLASSAPGTQAGTNLKTVGGNTSGYETRGARR